MRHLLVSDQNTDSEVNWLGLGPLIWCKIFNMIPETVENRIIRHERNGRSPYSVYYSLRLTCGAFNGVIIDRKNRRYLKNIRIPCREMVIAQRGTDFCIRLQNATSGRYREFTCHGISTETPTN
ncbi:hypothetical protein PMAYCL1PPCAC_04640, partial [Pristionchus mayeri]